MGWEQESIINWCEGEDEADIYTHSEKWINRLNSIGIKPYKEYEDGAKSYKISKKLLKLPTAKKIISEERRQQMSERFKKYQRSKRLEQNSV